MERLPSTTTKTEVAGSFEFEWPIAHSPIKSVLQCTEKIVGLTNPLKGTNFLSPEQKQTMAKFKAIGHSRSGWS